MKQEIDPHKSDFLVPFFIHFFFRYNLDSPRFMDQDWEMMGIFKNQPNPKPQCSTIGPLHHDVLTQGSTRLVYLA